MVIPDEIIENTVVKVYHKNGQTFTGVYRGCNGSCIVIRIDPGNGKRMIARQIMCENIIKIEKS